jgi:hypothetical protein
MVPVPKKKFPKNPPYTSSNYLSLNSSTSNLAAQQATYQFTYPSKGPYTEKSF